MKRYVINGGKELSGHITLSGSKNVVLKALVAACLTSEEVTLTNVPLISDFYEMTALIKEIGGEVDLYDHTVKIRVKNVTSHRIPLEIGAKMRTSSIFIAPLLVRSHEALIPNPGGCRIGARPIDRHIQGLEAMGATINYMSADGYFHAKTDGLKGTNFKFEKNTHTGTETLIIAAVMAEGITRLENAALEPEVDDLIKLLNSMGAKIRREEGKVIVIEGVRELHGTTFEIPPDRNELVTFAIASALTGGKILLKKTKMSDIKEFLEKFEEAGGAWEEQNGDVRFFIKDNLKAIDIMTAPYPGFMTDWQGPWAVLMTQAEGSSIIHETVYEYRFNYVSELEKMGAEIQFFNPKVDSKEEFYNFNYDESDPNYRHAIKIFGRTPFHNAVVDIADLRAGATLVIAALIAKGESVIYGVEFLERGYERFDERLREVGADIKLEEEEYEEH